MKKIVASVGLVAIGASGLTAVVAQDSAATPHSPLWPFSISASLKGFYDDNINTQPEKLPNGANNPAYQSSFGFQVTPAANINWQNEQTTFKSGLTYTYRQYEKKLWDTTQKYDQDFTFDADLTHQFTEAYSLEAQDSFVIGQEPDTLRSGYASADLQRISGNNIQNNGSIDFNAQLTPLFGLDIGYQNSLSDYADKSDFQITAPFQGIPSLAARLNRIEQYWHLDTKWHNWSQTTAIFGYTYSQSDYTTASGRANLSLSEVLQQPGLLGFDANRPLYSESRNYRAHYVYVGANSQLTSKFMGSFKVGFRATDYYNDETQSSIPLNPYANVNLTYNYGAESYIQGGFNYDRNATSVVGNPALSTSKNGNLTMDQESAVVFASIRHQLRPLTPNLYAGALVQFQNSTFDGGQYDGKNQQYFLLNLNLEYRIPHELTGRVDLSLTASYNFDKSESNVQQASPSYDRNRVFLGLTASY
jgi:hypothetical protein